MNIKTHSLRRTAAAIRRGGPLMNLTEVAETIGRSKNTVRALAAAGVLPPTVRGNRPVYRFDFNETTLMDAQEG